MGRRTAALAIGAVVGLVLAGGALAFALNQGSHQGQPPGQVAVTPTLPTLPTPSTRPSLKPEISGLLDRKGMPAPALRAAVPGFVVGARWADLQPTPMGPISENNVIDQAIAQIRAANDANSNLHMALKVRIYAGVDSPDWTKLLGGAAVDIHAVKGNVTGTVPRFWTEEFGLAYQDLMTKLAAKYDRVPEIEDVTISRCMTVFAEPFIRDVSDKQTILNFLAAGFTAEQDMACETAQIDEARAWKFTHLSLSFNPYQHIKPTGTSSNDEAFTEQVMEYCRNTLGSQCVLENNSIRSPNLPQYQAMYDSMQQLGPPLAFQTAVAHNIQATLGQTIEWAISAGANCVELPQGYDALLTPEQMLAYTNQLRSNRQ